MFNREEFFKKAAPILEKLYAGRNMDTVKERYVKAIDEFEALSTEKLTRFPFFLLRDAAKSAAIIPITIAAKSLPPLLISILSPWPQNPKMPSSV